jgi:hypothetical protein
MFETVVAAKVALAACTDVVLPRAAATPAAESARAMISPNSANLFLDIVLLLVAVISLAVVEIEPYSCTAFSKGGVKRR